MGVVFLDDVVDAGNIFGSFQLDVPELVVGAIIVVKSFLSAYPQRSKRIGEEVGDDVAANG